MEEIYCFKMLLMLLEIEMNFLEIVDLSYFISIKNIRLLKYIFFSQLVGEKKFSCIHTFTH